MTAKYEINIKLNIVQEIKDPSDLLDMYKIAEVAAQQMADELTDYDAVLTYELKDSTIDAR